jgi:hypothetical protein
MVRSLFATSRDRGVSFGPGIAVFFTRTRNRVLRPGLPAALPALRAVTLQPAFNTLATQIDAKSKTPNLPVVSQ